MKTYFYLYKLTVIAIRSLIRLVVRVDPLPHFFEITSKQIFMKSLKEHISHVKDLHYLNEHIDEQFYPE